MSREAAGEIDCAHNFSGEAVNKNRIAHPIALDLGKYFDFDANEARKFTSKEDAEANNKSPYHKYVAMEHGFG